MAQSPMLLEDQLQLPCTVCMYIYIYIFVFICSSVGRSWRRQSRDAPKMDARSAQQTPTGNLNTKTTVSDMVQNITQNRRRRCPRSLHACRGVIRSRATVSLHVGVAFVFAFYTTPSGFATHHCAASHLHISARIRLDNVMLEMSPLVSPALCLTTSCPLCISFVLVCFPSNVSKRTVPFPSLRLLWRQRSDTKHSVV